jgi:MoaA/NifB/PqqE/SkfB family radical SAM enzyme
MSTEEWKMAFNILDAYNVGFVVLFGGEPTLKDDLPELVEHLNELELPHTIITNSLRLNADESYYKRLMNAKPYGVSVSINIPEKKESFKFHDDIKSQEGWKLLQKLKSDGYTGDLVANMAVTKTNITSLPSMVELFTSMDVWSILSFIHLCDPHESMYWWYRGPVNEDNKGLLFTDADRPLVKEIGDFFVDNYDRLKLHNEKEYFMVWSTLGIDQNWKCSYFACPAINPDGSLMACIDRPLSKPISIFDLPEKEEELMESFKRTIEGCPGDFWDHMWSTNRFADIKKVEEGKIHYQHREVVV